VLPPDGIEFKSVARLLPTLLRDVLEEVFGF
jgi:hypothetical protein